MTGRIDRRRGERGTGLLEVVLTVSLFTLVLTALLETHTSFLFAAGRQERAIDARAIERLAVSEMGTDVRSAELIWPPSGATEAREQLTLTLPIRSTTGTETVRLRRDVAGGRLLRELLTGPGGAVVTTRVVATGVVDTGDPFVRYFGADGAELDPSIVLPAALVGCTMRFRLDVSIAPEPTRAPVRSQIDATPRGRRAEELSC